MAGSFTDVYGGTTDILLKSALISPVIKGRTYALRYRVKNIYGFGAWSPITFILAADKPTATAKPSFVSATDNSITINLYPSLNYGGAIVTDY